MKYLLAISIGPVQDFIAAARRTRDLWFGSQLLSEISRVSAIAVEEGGGCLIFPSSADGPNVANIILAEVKDRNPKEVADVAKDAAREYWKGVAQKVQADIQREFGNVIRLETWEKQADDVIEVYAAWVPRTDKYQSDRRRLNRLMAGRKNARDFRAAHGEPGVPKSSLDGQRESVLNDPKKGGNSLRARLRLADGEQLDVVGLVKRLGGGSKPYPSVARIAADPWIRGIVKRDGVSSLGSLIAACDSSAVLNRLDAIVFRQFKDFPFEGTAVYSTRHKEFREEAGLGPNDDLPLTVSLRELVKEYKEPNPHLAVLVADGDRVGAALSNKTTADEHREFSKKLAKFSAGVKAIIEKHQGVLVYAGGDDVLAFLPVDKCLDCARILHDGFGEVMNDQGEDITLSVGVGIGHFMENLEDLLEYGRAAERAAKAIDGKDALAVHLHKRGGAPIAIRGRWSDKLDERLAGIVKLINGEMLPARVAYDLRRMADLYRDWPDPKEAIQRDVKRLLAAKKPESGSTGTKEIEALIDRWVTDAASLESFAKELLVARLVAEVQRQADGKKEEAR